MNRLGHKLVALAVIFVTIFISTALPIKVSAWFERRGNKGLAILSGIMCFGGGVFLGTYLLHMTPEVEELIDKSINKPQNINYPIAHLIIGAGFFFMMFLERGTMELQSWRQLRAQKAAQVVPGVGTEGTQQVAVVELKTVDDSQKPGNSGQDNAGYVQDGRAVMGDGIPDTGAVENPPVPSGHSHLPENSGDSSLQGSAARSVVLLLALSIDCVFEGLSLGLQRSASGVWRMVLAILSHEIAVAFSLGLQLKRHNSSRRTFLMAFIYGITCPVGIAVGTAIMEGANKDMNIDLVYGVLLGITAGVFLYVAFFEILQHEITPQAKFLNIIAVVIGFGVMAGLLLIHNSVH